ncbi:MAG: hypothetical protein H6Q07_3157 [Acidobacteria bacterium]|jgi:hypothetical protein|nr:hypothetical protein [Acidobacteriota bacterium]
MQLWKRLYGTVWLAFFSCVIIPQWTDSKIGLWAHVVLGLVLLVITQINARSLQALPVPNRLKRISRVTAGFAIFQIVCGLAFGKGMSLMPAAMPVLRMAHVVCALAILAQSSSLATAFDMWEEKEFQEAPRQPA